MEILTAAAYSLFFLWLVPKLSFFSRGLQIGTRSLQYLLAAKLIAGCLLALLYTYYYTDRAQADIYKYYDDAAALFPLAQAAPLDFLRIITGIGTRDPALEPSLRLMSHWYKEFDYRLYNDNRTIIRFNAIVMLFSSGMFYVHVVFMAFVSFLGSVMLAKLMFLYSRLPNYIVAVSAFLVPSFLFWGSGLLKEGLLVFGIGLFLYSAGKCASGTVSAKYAAALVAGVFILAINKYYVLACMLPGFACFFIPANNRAYWLWAGSLHLLLFVAAAALHQHSFVADAIGTLAAKRNDFLQFAHSLGNVGSLLPMQKIEPSLTAFIADAPAALRNSFLLPYIWSAGSVFGAVSAAENIIFLSMLALAVFYRAKGQADARLICFSASFVLALYLLSGLITPVAGALVRYKAPALPFLFFLLASFTRWSSFLGNNAAGRLEKCLRL
jgi:hypothetical protein